MAIPVNELKAAVKALNSSGLIKAKVKVVGKKKEDIVISFRDAIADLIANDKAGELPDAAIDFYNDHIATEESEEEETAPAPKKKTTTKKTTTKKTTTKKDKPKSSTEPRETKKSVCIELLSKKGGASLKEMGEEITKRGIDDDTEKNTRTAGLWMRKIGFPVKKLENGNYIKAPAKK